MLGIKLEDKLFRRREYCHDLAMSEAELSEEEMTQELALALRSSGYRRGAVSTRFEYKHMRLVSEPSRSHLGS
jgi:hypothetical protein